MLGNEQKTDIDTTEGIFQTKVLNIFKKIEAISMKYLTNIFLIFILTGVNLSFALSTDPDQPINIQADKAMIDDPNGVAIYTGNVIVTQGSIRINAEKLTLNYTQKQDLEKAVAEGDPARFKQTPDGEKPDIHAKAKRMEYYAGQDMLQLTKEAVIWQGGDSFTGERITYDTRKGIIRAEKGKNQKDRVSVTIQPRKQ